MNEEAGELAGLTQEEAGERILAWLRERGQLEKRESYRHTVARVRPLQEPDRAADLAPVVVLDGRSSSSPRSRRCARARPVPSGGPAPLRDRLPRGRTRLEHLAPDLVGAPAAALGVPRRAHHRHRNRARRLRGVRVGRADPQRGRARHLVLVRALAVRDARLAGRHRGSPDVLPGQPEHDGARHHPPLGEPDDLRRPRADGGGPVHRRRHPFARARTDGRAHVEEPRHRDEPDRADRDATAQTPRATG